MPYKHILVPTDLSRYSLGALRYAAAIAAASGGRLILANFRNSNSGFKNAAQQLGELLSALPGVHGETIVQVGDPLAQILDVADERKVDLIVMGTQGRTGLRRALMGSVAEAVVRHAPCSVMTVRYPEPGEPYVDPVRGPRPALQKILVPLDFSAQSFEALPVAASLASIDGGTVQLMHVIDDPSYLHGPFMAPLELTQVARKEIEQAESVLKELGSRELRGARYSTLVGHGEAGPTILQAAHEQCADLVVMTTHGRSGLARLIMGSTAESVVRGCSCPVLTVRGASTSLALSSEAREALTGSL